MADSTTTTRPPATRVTGQRPIGGTNATRGASPAKPPPPLATWPLSIGLFVALAVTVGGLHVLFRDQLWWFVVVLVIAAVLGAAATVRLVTSRRILPPLASLVVLCALLILFFAPGSAILGVIPTLDTLADVGRLIADANTSIYRQAIPAVADSSIVFVLCLGVGGLAILCDILAITFRVPALAGIPLVVLLAIPAFTAREISDPFVFALAAAAYLLLLIAGRPRRQPALAAAIGGAAIVGALVAPAVLPAINFSSDLPIAGLSTGVNPVLGLGDDLRRASERSVLDYTTESGDAHYLRLVSLENFTGEVWEPTDTELDTANTVEKFAPAPGLSAEVATTAEQTTIDVGNLSSKWLPAPYPASSIDGLENDWFWEPDGFSISSFDDTARGQDYVVESLLLQPTPRQLLDAGTAVPADFERYLELPEDLPTAISAAADSVAASAGTNYEKALALQEYFRSDAFRYSEDAPVEGDYDGTGMEIIAQFLEARAGYCIHFASAMAVMARSLDIPSRVIVGFLPGDEETRDGVTSFNVTTHDLHSWPELYFEGIGWVQFEPTPGRGELGAYADVGALGVPDLVEPDAAAPGVAPSPTPSSSAPQGADRLDSGGVDTSDPAQSSALPFFALGIVALLFISLVPAIVRFVQRWRLAARLRGGTAAAIDAWTEVLHTAVDLRLPVATTETPRETARSIGGGASLHRLLAAVEREVYGGATRAGRSLVGELEASRAALLAAAARRTRLLALFYPASVWRRIGHPFTKPEQVRVENWRDDDPGGGEAQNPILAGSTPR